MPETTGKSRFYSQGLRFSCTRCSTCCRYEPGFVFLSNRDVSALKAALKLDHDKFLKTYCRWVPDEDGKSRLSLKEKFNYDCIFWEKEGCRVYESRPIQCVTFPFWPSVLNDEDSWEMTAKECPGMNQGSSHSLGSIEELLSIQRKEPIIEQFS
jgi:Fe-S-cluster containining protein